MSPAYPPNRSQHDGFQNNGAQPRPHNHNVIDLSQDEVYMPYKGTYSDEESQNQRMDIPASSVRPPKRKHPDYFDAYPQHPQQLSAQERFSSTPAYYLKAEQRNPAVGAKYPHIDVNNRVDLTGAYVGYQRSPKKSRPNGYTTQRTEAVTDIDQIADFDLRRNVERGLRILPSVGIEVMRKTMLRFKGNFNDALSHLTQDTADTEQVDLTISSQDDDELSAPATQHPARVLTKQKLNNKNPTINQKWGMNSQPATKAQIKVAPKRPAEADLSEDQSPIKPRSKRRHVVQSAEQQSSPESQSPIAITEDSDSSVDVVAPEKAWQGSLLRFFNQCSVADLVDMANIKKELAEHVLSFRPFKDHRAIKKIKEPEKKSATGKGRKSVNRIVGDRVYDTCSTMWKGYEAVDELVSQCAKLRQPILKGMKKWGVDVIGASKDGELDLVKLDDSNKCSPQSFHDSGIGTPISGDEKALIPKSTLIPQPKTMSKAITMKDYQVIGMNWLNLLFRYKLGCILADDMGLGKTCQIIAFLAHLKESGVQGPHVIVVPSSTLENWLREFANFCPDLQVTSYYGSQNERSDFRDEYKARKDRPYIIVTPYSVASQREDRKFLDKIQPTCAIFDEGHVLKNGESKRTVELMQIRAECRVLLTGTPLQNNLAELMTLLEFIMPETFGGYGEYLGDIFKTRAKTTDDDHSALLSAQRVRRARSMIAPFILRRKKDQVLQHLPTKTTRIEYCDLKPTQKTIYDETIGRAARILSERQNGAKAPKTSNKESANVMSDLRKACIHPLLFRRHYKDDSTVRKLVKSYMRNPANRERNKEYCFEDLCVMDDFEIHSFCMHSDNEDYMSQHGLDVESFLDSGKVDKLISLLKTYKANGDRVLLFSQFVIVLNILEVVLGHESLNMKFYRIDGATPVDQRQDLIDRFYAEEDVTCFMLSTKAGGAGINLAAANKVIIFDQSFNPQDDIQAENRAHRVGQTRPVEVVRMVTRGTIEEKILGLGESKVLLDEKVAGADAGKESEKVGNIGEKIVREAMERDIASFKAEKKVETKAVEKVKVERIVRGRRQVKKTKEEDLKEEEEDSDENDEEDKNWGEKAGGHKDDDDEDDEDEEDGDEDEDEDEDEYAE